METENLIPNPEPVKTEISVNKNKPAAPNAIAAMVVGICALGTSFIYGIPGIVCGIIALSLSGKAKRAYNSNPDMYSPGSGKMIKAGFNTGLWGLILSIVIFIAAVAFFAFVISEASHSYDYYDYDYNYDYGY